MEGVLSFAAASRGGCLAEPIGEGRQLAGFSLLSSLYFKAAGAVQAAGNL